MKRTKPKHRPRGQWRTMKAWAGFSAGMPDVYWVDSSQLVAVRPDEADLKPRYMDRRPVEIRWWEKPWT